MSRVRNVIALLRGQLWIIPSFISVLALALAFWLLYSGLAFLEATDFWWIYSGDATSARNLLSSLLAGLMTMVSLVVSVTFVILTLAANQLGPRLISTFMGDRQIQSVLGLFLGTILYVLVVLRTLNDTLGEKGVPHIAVTVGSALTVVCLFALLFYVHKIARSIIADIVVDRVAGELRGNIRDMLPPLASAVDTPPRLSQNAVSLGIDCRGYLQTVDYDALVELASRCDAVFRVHVRAGHFVLRRGNHVSVYASRALDDDAVAAVRAAFIMGAERSPAQDLEFSLRQLVEIALRALSPGINDPFTAIAVVDQLGGAMEEILARGMQPAILRDADEKVRVIADRSTIVGLGNAAFDMIRQAAGDHPSVLIRMADIWRNLAPALQHEEARNAILQHFDKLQETARLGALTPTDCEAVLQRIEQGRAAVEKHEAY